MRKHFLILMLMALLPLAGWAENYTVKIQIGSDEPAASVTKTYTGTAFTITAIMANETNITTNGEYTKTWYKGGVVYDGPFTDVGTYTLQVTNGSDTFTEASLTISPIDPLYPVDLSDGWSIKLTPATAIYSGTDLTPTVTLVKDSYTSPLTSTDFNVEWNATEIKTVNGTGYTVTVTNDMTHTYGNLATPTKTFWILKATPYEDTPGVLVDDDLGHGGNQVAYNNGEDITLVKTAPVVKLDDAGATNVTAAVIGGKILYSLDQQNWSEDFPKASKVGTYTVYYKVEGTDNYNGLASTPIGDVTITGQSLVVNTDYTAPTGKSALAFRWNNGAVEQELISAGTTPTNKGTMKYSLDGTTFLPAIPTASTGGTHRVYWMVEAIDGYYDVKDNSTQYVDVTIAKVTPEVTAATGSTTLVYNPTGNQKLLTAVGRATFGASVKYKVMAPGESVFGEAIASLDDVVGTNAGNYKVKTLVEENDNYNAAENETDITVTIATAPAFTEAPTAADVTWDGTPKVLINAGLGTVPGKVKYSLNGTDWSTDINNIVGTAGIGYTVYYKVDAENYTAVSSTAISNVKIKKRPLSVKVNDLTKTYDGNATITASNTTVDGGGARFTFITPITGKDDFTAITATSYAEITATDAMNAGPHAGVVTVALSTLEAVNTAKGYYYDYVIIPGKLTVNQKELYVTASNQATLTTNMTAVATYNLADKYSVTGIVGSEDPWATDGAPVLTSPDAPTPIVPGEYTLAFTPGTLKANGNYKMRAENPYVIADDLKFIVNPAEGSKVVVTVLPHDKYYGEEDPDFSEWEEGTDYYVTGLASGDNLVGLTFSRAPGEVVKAGNYALTATATVAHSTWYDEAITFNNSTFEIKPKVLTATVAQQIVVKEATALPDPTAWEVEGLVDATINGVEIKDTKAGLGGTLAMSTTAAPTTEGTITLAITNPNYTLKTGTNVGVLIVIDDATFVLNPNDANFVDLINAAGTTEYKITFMDQTKANYNGETTTNVGFTKTLKAGQWNTLVLPFSTTVEEVSAALGYAVVDVLDESNDNPDAIKLKLAFNELPAHKPFLVQPKVTKKLSEVNYWNSDLHKKALAAVPAVAKAEDGAEHAFIGKYTDYKVMPENKNEYFYSNNDKAFRNAKEGGSGTWINIFSAYLLDGSNKARVITIQEADGSTTAISTINADGIAVPAEGWYTLNGVKLQGVPTEKGIYIHNGKKLVVK